VSRYSEARLNPKWVRSTLNRLDACIGPDWSLAFRSPWQGNRWCRSPVRKLLLLDAVAAARKRAFSAWIRAPSDHPSGQSPGVQERLRHAKHDRSL